MQFQNTTLSAEMLQAIATQNFTEMTEIQAKTIPLLLEGKDVIGKSNTGTGKTAAFSIAHTALPVFYFTSCCTCSIYLHMMGGCVLL